MKKIIKSSILLLGICFISGKASAQLASDAPALTPAKVAEIQKKNAAPAAKTITVQTASSSASVPARIAVPKPASAEPAASPSAAPAKLPAVSDQGQGTVVPATKAAEPKVPAVVKKSSK